MEIAIDDIIPIEPIEFQRARVEYKAIFDGVSVHNPRILRYREFSFNPHITENILLGIVKKTRVRKDVAVYTIYDRYIVYKYGSEKPTIILDPVMRRVCTTKQMIREHGESVCQQQASILMRLLKQHGHANFRRVTITVDPQKIGWTIEDRELTFNAIRSLMDNYDMRADISKKAKNLK